jgi:hypothetical protein
MCRQFLHHSLYQESFLVNLHVTSNSDDIAKQKTSHASKKRSSDSISLSLTNYIYRLDLCVIHMCENTTLLNVKLEEVELNEH